MLVCDRFRRSKTKLFSWLATFSLGRLEEKELVCTDSAPDKDKELDLPLAHIVS